MFCPTCGRDIPVGAVCPECSGGPKYSSNPAVNVLKTVGASKKFLFAAILFTLSSVISIFNASGVTDSVDQVLGTFMSSGMIDSSAIAQIQASYQAGVVSGIVVSSLGALLTILGLWLIFVPCSSRRTGNVSTVGFTICRVLTIIELVCAWIVAVILIASVVLIGGSIASLLAQEGVSTGAALTPLIVTAVVVVAVMVFVILFLSALSKTLKRMKRTALSGVPNNRVPHLLTVILYIAAVCQVIFGVVNLFSAPVEGLGQLCSGASLLLIALCLTNYRKRMTGVMFAPAPAPAPAVSAPQAPTQPPEA